MRCGYDAMCHANAAPPSPARGRPMFVGAAVPGSAARPETPYLAAKHPGEGLLIRAFSRPAPPTRRSLRSGGWFRLVAGRAFRCRGGATSCAVNVVVLRESFPGRGRAVNSREKRALDSDAPDTAGAELDRRWRVEGLVSSRYLPGRTPPAGRPHRGAPHLRHLAAAHQNADQSGLLKVKAPRMSPSLKPRALSSGYSRARFSSTSGLILAA
jgi:hypothetical protein